MKIRQIRKGSIEVGDLVRYKNTTYSSGVFLVTCYERMYIEGVIAEQDNVYPYILLDLDSGLDENAFKTLEVLRESCELVAKNDDITLDC